MRLTLQFHIPLLFCPSTFSFFSYFCMFLVLHSLLSLTAASFDGAGTALTLLIAVSRVFLPPFQAPYIIKHIKGHSSLIRLNPCPCVCVLLCACVREIVSWLTADSISFVQN